MIPFKEERLPPVRSIPFDVNGWQGVNKVKGTIAQGEMRDMKNMSSDNYPYSSPRKSREVVKTGIVNPQNIFSANDKLGYIADGKLYYTGGEELAEIGTVGMSSSVIDFNGRIICYPSNHSYDYIENSFIDSKVLKTKKVGYYDKTGTYYPTGNSVLVYNGSSPEFDVYVAMFCVDGGIIVTGKTSIVIDTESMLLDESLYDIANMYLVFLDAENNALSIKTYSNGEADYFIETKGGVVSVPTGAVTMFINFGYADVYAHYIVSNTTVRDSAYTNGNVWVNISNYPTDGVPNIKYACVDNNRVFAVEGNNVYTSSLGDYSKWTEFVDEDGNPNPTGSYAEKLETPQDFTGVVKYKNNVVMIKPDFIYECYGNKPPYRIMEIAKTGCIDGRTIVEVNSVLYWLGRNGIYQYTGGQPRIISQKLNKTFVSGVAGTDGRKYYCSLYDGTTHCLYVYDTYNGLWHIEDNIEVVGFAYSNGFLYAITKTGEILKFNSGNERVIWSFETQDYDFGIPETKNLAKLYIRVDMKPNTSLDVYVLSNNGEYNRVANYQADDQTTFDFKVRIKKCDTFSLKFEGVGDVRILDIHGKVTVGTSKHRSGDNLSVFRG